MNKELSKTLTTALVQWIERERPEGTVCCSSYECEQIEKAFEGGCYDVVENLIKKKLTGLTELEQCLLDYANARDEFEFDSTRLVELNNKVIELTKSYSKKLLALAKKEICKGCDANLRGYIKGQEDAEKRYNESVAYHYPESIPTGVAYKSPQCYTDVLITPNTNSGTSTLKAEG